MEHARHFKPALRIVTLVVTLFAATILTGGAGSAIWVKCATPVEPEVQNSFPPPLPTIRVGALGRLEPGWKVFQIGAASSTSGTCVENLYVEEGDEVVAGAILATLDTNSQRVAALKEASAQVLVYRAKLLQVKAGPKAEEVAAQEFGITKLKTMLATAESAFNRATRLRSKSVMSTEEFEQKQADLDSNRSLLHQAESTLVALKTVRSEDVLFAEAELAKADAGVARAEADLEVTNIRSPISGRVLKLFARARERVGDSGMAEIGDTNHMHAVAEVHERDAAKVQLGQRATVKVQCLPYELSGEVVCVGWKVGRQVVFDNDPVKDTDARVIEVRVKLDSESSARVARFSYARTEVRIEITNETGSH